MSGYQKLSLAALAAGLLLVFSAPAGAYPPGYIKWYWRYDQHPVCLASATVRLAAAQVVSGEVAVWSGVSRPDNGAWLQAGVAVVSNASLDSGQYVNAGTSAPFRYVEWKSHGQPHLVQLGPGNSLQVRLTRLGDRWRLQASKRSWTVRIGPKPDCQVGAESWDNPGPNMVKGTVSYYGGSFAVGLPS
ncbi:MAG: hypothetical protein ACREGG_04390 [Candidatus Saccharimonadales bacterium]